MAVRAVAIDLSQLDLMPLACDVAQHGIEIPVIKGSDAAESVGTLKDPTPDRFGDFLRQKSNSSWSASSTSAILQISCSLG